ncbi:MAG: HD domain-containing protein [Paludibacteraceae bacterium]|nr:HD domain-containing protein [Paludibacteraceae bacterium]
MNPTEIIDKNYDAQPELRDVLLTHSGQVRDRALRIADAHPEWEVDRAFIAEAAMLHDIGILYCNAPGIYCTGDRPYIEHGWLGAELLRREGYPRHALVAERHTGVGIPMEQLMRDDVDVPLADYYPVSLEEKIICYADKFYSKSHLERELTKDQVRFKLWRYGHDAILRWDNLVSLMGE